MLAVSPSSPLCDACPLADPPFQVGVTKGCFGLHISEQTCLLDGTGSGHFEALDDTILEICFVTGVCHVKNDGTK